MKTEDGVEDDVGINQSGCRLPPFGLAGPPELWGRAKLGRFLLWVWVVCFGIYQLGI